jgi:hypothetical protein
MKKLIAFVLSLSFCVTAYANDYISHVYITNQSPHPIKVYGEGIVYYEFVYPAKSAKTIVRPASQMSPLQYRVVAESGGQLNYSLRGLDKECKARWSFVEYQSNDDKPGVFILKSTYCDPGHP